MSTIERKPILHGRDHCPGGADPIPCLIGGPFGTIDEAILATAPGAYYKLPETGSDDWADSSGSGRDATYISRTGLVRGVASDLDESDGSLCATLDGPTASSGQTESHVAECIDEFFCFPTTSEFSVTARIRPSSLPGGTWSWGICGNVREGSPNFNAIGWGLFIGGSVGAGKPLCRRRAGGSNQDALGGTALTADAWVRLTATFDGTTLSLYADDTLLDSAGSPPSFPAAGGTTSQLQIGGVGISEGIGGTQAPFEGEIDSVAIWDRCLAPSEVGGIADFEAGGSDGAGTVLTSDGSGGTVWSYPTFEVDY